jgi:hypothetical protein
MIGLGHWSQRKHTSALEQKHDAIIKLQESGVPIAKLECEWKAQVEAQLVSAPHTYQIMSTL